MLYKSTCVKNEFSNSAWSTDCKPTPKKGGIPRFLFQKKVSGATEITTKAQLEAAITSGNVLFSGELLGKREKGSQKKAKVSSTSPEIEVSTESKYSFTDYSALPFATSSLNEYDFWQFIRDAANEGMLNVGFVTGDERVFLYSEKWSLTAENTEPETVEELAKIEGEITITNADPLKKPIKMEGILEFIDNFSATITTS